MAKAAKAETDLLTPALALIADRGWRGFSFAELARRAGVTLGRVYAEFPVRAAILRKLGRRLDAEMLALTAAELDGMSPRERVFELVMRRLDAMASAKPALRAIAEKGAGDPGLAASGLINVGRLADRLIDAAEAGDGPGARLVVAAIYVRVFNVWLKDDTPDLGKTLAELDRRLQQAEGVARWFRQRRPGANDAGTADPAAA